MYIFYLDMNERYLLVMEYADGGSLRNYLKNNFSNLTWEDKYNLAYQLAEAVSCLHDEEIVHRDLVINLLLKKVKRVYFYYSYILYVFFFNSTLAMY
jgi:serine/threonine protein kinase